MNIIKTLLITLILALTSSCSSPAGYCLTDCSNLINPAYMSDGVDECNQFDACREVWRIKNHEFLTDEQLALCTIQFRLLDKDDKICLQQLSVCLSDNFCDLSACITSCSVNQFPLISNMVTSYDN
jgi:hypothetical protein